MRKLLVIISLSTLVLIVLNLIPSSAVAQQSPEGWSPKINLSTEPHSPEIVVDGKYVHVIWTGGFYTRSTDGGNTWSPAVQLTPSGNSGQAITVSNGFVHYVWGDSSGIWYMRSNDNGESWVPGSLRHLETHVVDNNIEICARGEYVHVLYLDTTPPGNPGDHVFYIGSSSNGDIWSNSIQLSSAYHDKSNMDIAISGNYVHAVWKEYWEDPFGFGTDALLYRRSSDNGTTWESISITWDSGGGNRYFNIAANNTHVHFVWHRHSRINYKRSTDYGSTWTTEISLPQDSEVEADEPDMVAWGDNVYVVYDGTHNATCSEVYLVSSNDNGNSWGDYLRLTNALNLKDLPKIGVSGNSNHVAYQIWASSNEEEERIWYMRTLPNILPTSIQFSNNPTEEYIVMINATIDNHGYADAYDVNVTCHINDGILSSQTIDLLELNAPQTAQFQWTPPSFGDYNIRIEVDPNNASYEWDETDNDQTQEVYINAIPTASLAADPTTVYTGETVSFDASASSDDGTIVTYYFDFGDGSSNELISPTTSRSYSSSGTFTASLTVKDNNGIESTNPAEVPINVINRPPSVEINYPTGGEVSGLETITGTSSDPDGTVESVYVSIDNIVNWESAAGITSWSCEWDTTIYSNGEHIIYAKAYDGEDSSEIVSVSVIVDNGGNIAPQVSITYPNDGSTVSGEIEIQGTASDDDGYVQLVEIKIDDEPVIGLPGATNWKYDWDTTEYSNGEHTIKARAKDDLNEYSQENSITVIVSNGGNILPSVKITSHSGGEVVSGEVKIRGTAVDHDGNVKLVEVRIDDDNNNWITAVGTTSWAYTWDTTIYNNGEHVIYARAKDDADEYSQVKSIILVIKNGGNIPPIVYIISPLSGTVTGTVTIRGSATDIDGDETIASVQIKIDDDWEYADGTTDWIYIWNTTSFDDGNYTIFVRAFDGIDYSMVKNVPVYVDNPYKPILTITSEIPKIVSGTITIKGTASDVDGEVTKIEIQIDDGEWKEAEGTIDWSFKLDTSKLSNGKHTLTIKAYDDEGEYTIESLNFTVENPTDLPWLLLVLVIIIVVIFVIVGLILRKRKTKANNLRVAPLEETNTIQAQKVPVRCPSCGKSFEIVSGLSAIQCPHCGLEGKL